MINDNIIISDKITLLDALKIMDATRRKLLIVCEGKRFLGVISIGDIQRAILSKRELNSPVMEYARTVITIAHITDDLEKVKDKMRSEKIEAMPVVNSEGELCDVIEWEQLFSRSEPADTRRVDIPVVIMAGGKGSRLLPLTNVIPKPLIPVTDKTIIEEIMSRFISAGCGRIYVSVNYMVETIKDYFSKRPQWKLEYIQERKPLGTGGSLYLLKGRVRETFIVTNCDTLVDTDLYDLVDYHRSNRNMITVVTAVKTIHIPYGTIETVVDGVIEKMREKPDLVFQVNTGLYVLEPQVLDYIEDDKFLDLPDLIKRLTEAGHRVGAFPVSEGSWTDIGNWDEYLRLGSKYTKG